MAPDAIPQAPAHLAQWLAAGAHGDMDWMAETADRRSDPRTLWSQTRSIVVLGMNYGPETNPLDERGDASRAILSVYARNRDYHDVIKGRLKTLAQWLVKEGRALAAADASGDAQVKVFVDTAPVMEKPLAAAAGLGWQGKHTNLVSREYGSWLFLGSIFTTLDIAPDAPEPDHCGSCRACLDACPTGAFPAPYKLDARRCVSYLTIEHKGQIPHEFREAIGTRVYGCDDCLAACPWNKFAQSAREAKLQAREELKSPRLADLAALDDAGFRALFSGGPVKRIGHARFIRNVLLAIGNSGDSELAPLALARLEDPSPLVRGMAVWAASRLLDAERFAALRSAHLARETDALVREEWGALDHGPEAIAS
ncbi:MAG: epoxyqueuosine reductase [Hyphomicrobiales bacterium]|nr:epoxyqueuosine reductase [Hyphomicrobiales bacterium]